MSIDSNIELYLTNRDAFQKFWKGSSHLEYSLAALLCTVRNVTVDADEIEKCETILKEKQNAFSVYRGFSQSAVISMMAGQPDPSSVLDESLQIFDTLKRRFLIDDYLPAGAMIIALMNQPEWNQEIIERSQKIFKSFQAKHPFITDSQDSVLCILLGCTEYPVEQITDHTETCIRLLKKGFFTSDHYQSLGMVLALYPDSPEEKASKVQSLLDEFNKQNIKWGRNFELALTGSLAMSQISPEIIVQMVTYADGILSKSKGFQLMDFADEYRTTLAASLVLDSILENKEADYFVVGSLIGILIAEYIMIMMPVTRNG